MPSWRRPPTNAHRAAVDSPPKPIPSFLVIIAAGVIGFIVGRFPGFLVGLFAGVLFSTFRFLKRGPERHAAVLNALLAKITFPTLARANQRRVVRRARVIWAGGGNAQRGSHAPVADTSLAGMSEFKRFSLFAMAMLDLRIEPSIQEPWDPPPRNPFMLRLTDRDVEVQAFYLKKRFGIDVSLQLSEQTPVLERNDIDGEVDAILDQLARSVGVETISDDDYPQVIEDAEVARHGVSDTTDIGEAPFEIAKAVCVPALRLAQIADVLCQSKSAPAEGLTSGQFTAIAQECIAFLVHCCDVALYGMVGPAGRSRAMDRIYVAIQQGLMMAERRENTKYGPRDDLIPGVKVSGIIDELLNDRNTEYGQLTKLDGDFELSIEAFAKRVAGMVPQACAEDMHTLSVNQSVEYLTGLEALLTPSLAEKLAS